MSCTPSTSTSPSRAAVWQVGDAARFPSARGHPTAERGFLPADIAGNAAERFGLAGPPDPVGPQGHAEEFRRAGVPRRLHLVGATYRTSDVGHPILREPALLGGV